MTDPYKLMLGLRNNRILFQYMELSSVVYDDTKGWTIHGESSEGDFYVYELTSGVLRLVLPIPVPPAIPTEAMTKIVVSAQDNLEGMIGVNYTADGCIIEYYIHAMESSESLDAALIKFTKERRELKNGLKEIEEGVKQMMTSMAEMMQVGVPSNQPVDNSEESSSQDVWSTMADIEKNLDDNKDTDDSSEESDEEK